MNRLTAKLLSARYRMLAFSVAVSALLIPVSVDGDGPTGQPAIHTPAVEAAVIEPADWNETLAASPERGARRVAIQAGHWRPWEAPEEFRALRTSTGAAGDGWSEAEVNLDVSRRVARILEDAGIEVELLPATVPPDYRADAFVSIHGDANPDAGLSGFKACNSTWSKISELEERLLDEVVAEYEAATGLEEHRTTITGNMRQYYAFNKKFRHTVHPETPAIIFEMGFLTNDGDRKLLLEDPDRVAEGIARGIIRFLDR